jgi:hypothetical protein
VRTVTEKEVAENHQKMKEENISYSSDHLNQMGLLKAQVTFNGNKMYLSSNYSGKMTGK